MKEVHSSGGRGLRRKVAILATGLVLASLLGAVGTAVTASASSLRPAAAKKLVIAYNMGSEADPFFIAMNVGAAAEANKLGVTLDWQGDPSVYSPSTQIPIVEEMLAEHPDGLVISPTDPNALQPIVNEAVAEGIPVSNVDTHVTDLSHVLTFITGNNAQGGEAAADAMAKAMHYTAGQTYQVAVGMSSPTTTTNTARLAGFKAEIAKKYPGIKIVAVAYSQSEPAVANSNVNDWLTRFPHLNGIFAIDGTNASGASAAIEAHGLVGKIALVGYDAYANNVALLQKGVFAALISQQPALEGQLEVQYMVQYLRTHSTKGIPHLLTLPNIVLTPSSSAAVLAKYSYPTA
jgi:ABC-type sugar transport system substrate-binding protein